jgi:hypothetical protein
MGWYIKASGGGDQSNSARKKMISDGSMDESKSSYNQFDRYDRFDRSINSIARHIATATPAPHYFFSKRSHNSVNTAPIHAI